MTDTNQSKKPEIKVDLGNLYQDETFTDLKLGWIRRLTPVKPDGSRDESRESVFIGQTQLVSPGGPIPVHCQIPAATLTEAIEKFPAVMEKTIYRMIEESMERQRQMASQFLSPEQPKE
jgi:hypothetical protein